MITEAPLRLLLLEDNEGDARLTRTLLADAAPGRFAVTCVERLAEALALLRLERFDVVLCDLHLPDSSGFATVQGVIAQAPALALVVLTGSHDDNLGPESIRQGAQDYLVKGEYSGELMTRSLRYAIERKRLETSLRAANETLEKRVAERVRDLDIARSKLLETVARHEAIARTAVDAIVTADGQGTIRSWNRAAERIFGYAEVETLGQSVAMLIPQRYREAHLARMRRVAAGGDRRVLDRTIELIGLSKDGREFPLELSLAEWDTAEGRFFTGIIRDVSERKRAEGELARLAAIVEGSGDAIMSRGPDGRIITWNAAAETLFGYCAEEAIGRDVDFIVPAEELAVTAQIRARVEQGLAVQAFDAVRVAKNGRRIDVSITPSPMRDAEGRLTAVSLILRDITERKHAERALRRQKDLYNALSLTNKMIARGVSRDDLFQSVCRIAVEQGHFLFAWIGLSGEDDAWLNAVAKYGDDAGFLEVRHATIGKRNTAKRGLVRHAVDSGVRAVANDFFAHPETAPWREAALRCGVRAFAAFPIRQSAKVVGAINVYAGERGYFTDDLLDMLDAMAVDVSFALDNMERQAERRRAEAELRAAEERFRGLVEQSIAGICIVRDGTFAYVNPRFAEIHGYATGEELIGRESVSMVAETDRDLVAEMNRRVLAGEVPRDSVSFTALRKDGSSVQLGANSALATYQGRPAIIGMVQDISEKKRAEQQKQDYLKQLETAFMSTVSVAMTLGEMRDPYIAGHARRVAELAAAIGAELGFDAGRQEGLRVAGHLHDIGKIIVPSEILAKPGRLQPIEFELIKGHAAASYDVLKQVALPWPVAQVAWQHHERMDGSGYPQGLKGDAILLEARIVAVADVVEAMASDRPYRAGLGIDRALAEIGRGRDSIYDAAVADACLRLFREKGYTIPA